MNFWDSDVWGGLIIIASLLISLLIANLLKKSIRFLRLSLIPTSVLGGILLLGVSLLYRAVTGNVLYDTAAFGNAGIAVFEVITYHCLALGFIATTFKSGKSNLSRHRSGEIFNTGVTTVATYIIQAIFGIGFTYVLSLFIREVFPASGALLCFGFGQGTGQALNYGGIYEQTYGFTGGASFGLTIAALGFIAASLGGVVHLHILRKRGKIDTTSEEVVEAINAEQIQNPDEIPMNGSIDKMTVQVAIVVTCYVITYLLMYGLSALLPGFRSILYGFNFLLGVLSATLVKWILRLLRRSNVVQREYVNPFLMNRLGGFFFDIMIVAGIAAIQIDFLADYWYVLLILAVGGTLLTYWYNRFVAKALFPHYTEAQFLAMYGMLTGTASTGMILLREVDPDFKTPAAENLVLQNFPAIVFGFPMMLLATWAPQEPLGTLIILVPFFLFLNVLLFRTVILRRFFRKKSTK